MVWLGWVARWLQPGRGAGSAGLCDCLRWGQCADTRAPTRTSWPAGLQSVYELSDGSGLVLTVGKYVTPKGTDIDREGLLPDFRSAPGAEAADSAIRACRVQRAAAQAAAAPAAQQQAGM